jgi:hypothetical protein
MDESTLFVGMIAGAIGVGYLVYGKKQQRVMAYISGVGLIVLPYLIDPLWGQLAACAVLVVLPWVVRV